MTTNTLDPTQRKAAIIAGFTLIFAIVIVVVSNYSITFRYIIPGDVAQTARNIMAHETLFRFNTFCNLIYLITLILMSTSLYILLRPVQKNLALAAAFFRFFYALIWGFMAINTLSAIRFLGDTGFLQVFNTDQLYTLSRLQQLRSWDAYYVGLPFWGLAAAACSYLLFKSRYIPRTLAVFGILTSVWCTFCGFAFLIFPGYGEMVHLGLFDVPLTLFEIILGFWLLGKGFRKVK